MGLFSTNMGSTLIGTVLVILVDNSSHVLTLTQCTHESISACFYLDSNITWSPDINAVPVYNDITLDWICGRSYVQMENCLDQHKLSCPDLYLNIAGTEKALDYLCTEGRLVYMSQRRCLQLNTLHESMALCNETYNRKLDSLSYMTGSRAVRVGKLCQYMNAFLSCLRTSTTSTCGKAAGEWMYEFNYKLLSFALNRIQCPQGTNAAVLWGTIIACIFAVIIVIIIILISKRKIEKKYDLRRSVQSQHIRGFSKASVSRTCATTPINDTNDSELPGNSILPSSRDSNQSNVIEIVDDNRLPI